MSRAKEIKIAAAQLLVVSICVVGGLFWYHHRVQDKVRVHNLLLEARKMRALDDFSGLMAARNLYIKTGRIDSDDRILSQFAESSAELVTFFGSKSLLKESEGLIARLAENGVNTPERYAAESYVLVAKGQARTAEGNLQKLFEDGLRHPKLFHAMSVAQLAQGNAKAAERSAIAGLKLSASLMKLVIAQADAHLAMGNYPSARHAYRKVLSVNPQHMRAKIGIALSDALLAEGNPDLLMKEFEKLLKAVTGKALSLSPSVLEASLYHLKSELLLRKGEFASAIDAASYAVNIEPRLAGALVVFAQALGRQGKVDEAREKFEEALALRPASRHFAKMAFWNLRGSQGASSLVPLFESVSEFNPEDGYVHVDLADLYAESGMLAEAQKATLKAENILGDGHEMVYFAKGRLLQEKGKIKEAQEAYQKAVQAAGRAWGDILFQTGRLKLRARKYSEAVHFFDEAGRFWEHEHPAAAKLIASYQHMARDLKKTRRGSMRRAARKYEKKAKALLRRVG